MSTILSLFLSLSPAQAQDRSEILASIQTAAVEHGIDPNLAVAIATVESNLNPNTVGLLNEQGLFQLRPEYHPVAKGDIRGNIQAAMLYLTRLKKSCASYGDAFFVCFNLGEYKKIRYPTKFPYYSKVMKVVESRRASRRLVVN